LPVTVVHWICSTFVVVRSCYILDLRCYGWIVPFYVVLFLVIRSLFYVVVVRWLVVGVRCCCYWLFCLWFVVGVLLLRCCVAFQLPVAVARRSCYVVRLGAFPCVLLLFYVRYVTFAIVLPVLLFLVVVRSDWLIRSLFVVGSTLRFVDLLLLLRFLFTSIDFVLHLLLFVCSYFPFRFVVRYGWVATGLRSDFFRVTVDSLPFVAFALPLLRYVGLLRSLIVVDYRCCCC